ncbi:MAG: S1 RNA-binding domain-containing protein [Planctomycetes bacterium]|nr:S1 RNA-binding domain-containing protein [Planctomycetota bacterium]
MSSNSSESPNVDQSQLVVEAPSADRPSQRIQIGSQRATAAPQEAKAKPVTPAAPAAPPPKKREPKHYPPPNIRDQLSPELEQEYQEALGDVSLDALMNEATAADSALELLSEARVSGVVARIHGEDVFVDLFSKEHGAGSGVSEGSGSVLRAPRSLLYQGVVPLRQFEQAPTEDDVLELLVVRFDADEGLYELSRPTAAVDVGNWDEVSEGQIIEVTVTGSNKGGLECQVAGIRGFIPMGQVSIYRVENPEELVGQRLACVVTEASRERRNLVLSHRAVMERERNELRDKLLAELAPGQIREGIVRSMKDFGAFVDLGGVDGLAHVSQLSWDRVNHPSEVLEVGQKIKVRIEKFDKETGKVSLSYREVGANPWQNVESQFPVGSRATGPVSRLMDFGAFVKLAPGVEGLIHISELAHGRVFRVSDVLSAGQEVEVKILSVDAEKQRISLSLKALMSPPEKPGQQKVADEDMPLPADAPQPPRTKATHLKGGIGGPSGGEKFGLNW